MIKSFNKSTYASTATITYATFNYQVFSFFWKVINYRLPALYFKVIIIIIIIHGCTDEILYSYNDLGSFLFYFLSYNYYCFKILCSSRSYMLCVGIPVDCVKSLSWVGSLWVMAIKTYRCMIRQDCTLF